MKFPKQSWIRSEALLSCAVRRVQKWDRVFSSQQVFW